MKKPQRIVLAVGLSAAALIGLGPPRTSQYGASPFPLSYPLWDQRYAIDPLPLLVWWAVIALATAAGLVLLRRPPQ